MQMMITSYEDTEHFSWASSVYSFYQFVFIFKQGIYQEARPTAGEWISGYTHLTSYTDHITHQEDIPVHACKGERLEGRRSRTQPDMNAKSRHSWDRTWRNAVIGGALCTLSPRFH